MDNRKSEREEALLGMGFDLRSQTEDDYVLSEVAEGRAALAFSGYGEFTPITVRSDTVLENANVE